MPINEPSFAVPDVSPGVDDLFKQSISDLAYRAFAKGFPTLLAKVMTFLPIATDVEKGTALGTFLLRIANDIIFVPIVCANGTSKPLDLAYSRGQDRFVPLDNYWIERMASQAPESMAGGTMVQMPKTVQQDVDLRSLVIPPMMQGRNVYAALAAVPFHSALRSRAKLAADSGQRPTKLLDLLKGLPNGLKKAALRYLDKNEHAAEALVAYYGRSKLAAAFEPNPITKKANDGPIAVKREVMLVTPSNNLGDAIRKLGPGESPVMQAALKTVGYYVKDFREPSDIKNDLHIEAATTYKAVTPDEPGIYRIYLADGTSELALAIPRRSIIQTDDVAMECHNASRPTVDSARTLLLFADGYKSVPGAFCAEKIRSVGREEIQRWVDDNARAMVTNDSTGVLIGLGSYGIQCTDLIKARHISREGTKVDFRMAWAGTHGTMNSKHVHEGVIQSSDGSRMLFGHEFKWIPLKADYETDKQVLDDPKLVVDAMHRALVEKGATKVAVSRTNEGYKVAAANDDYGSRLDAAVKIANAYSVPLAAAAAYVQMLDARIPCAAYALAKTAAGADPMAQQAMQPGMDPNMPPAGPPPIDPALLAISAKRQQTQQQIMALQQRDQDLAEVEAHIGQIGQSGAAAAPMAAASAMGMDTSSINGMPTMAPIPQEQAPMEEQEPPPPPPVMMNQPDSPEMLQGQVNEDYLGDAQALYDSGAFDATAISGLAAYPSFTPLMLEYSEDLEKAQDKLGRLLLFTYLRASELQEEAGPDDARRLEDTLRNAFKQISAALKQLSSYQHQPGGAQGEDNAASFSGA